MRLRLSSAKSLSAAFLILITFSNAKFVRSDAEFLTETADVCGGHQTASDSCNIRCFRADPVCGVNGVTYWCGCPEAACEGVKVARKGYCQVGNAGSSGQALLLVHIVWLIVLGVSVLFGLF